MSEQSPDAAPLAARRDVQDWTIPTSIVSLKLPTHEVSATDSAASAAVCDDVWGHGIPTECVSLKKHTTSDNDKDTSRAAKRRKSHQGTTHNTEMLDARWSGIVAMYVALGSPPTDDESSFGQACCDIAHAFACRKNVVLRAIGRFLKDGSTRRPRASGPAPSTTSVTPAKSQQPQDTERSIMASTPHSTTMKSNYGICKELPAGTSFADAVERTKKAFTDEKFGLPPGTLTVDLPAVFKAKGVDDNFNPCMIFGFCKPQMAHHALMTEGGFALLVPCNVAIREFEPGRVEVACMDPYALLGLAQEKEALVDSLKELRASVQRAMAAI